MNSILELVSIIKDRPTMYLGANTISNLKAFVDGWCFRDPNNIADYDKLVGFQRWVEAKYRIQTAHSWAHILLFFALDEYQAFQLFFKEFDLYLSENGL